MGEICIVVTEDLHVGLEFPVGHSRSLAVDDSEIGWWNEFGCFVGVVGCGVENEATTHLVPFLVLVLFFASLSLMKSNYLWWRRFWCSASLWVRVIPVARDWKTSDVPDGSPVGVVVVGGLICLVCRRMPKAASSPSSGSTEKQVSGTIAW